jgi:hypothetical protein
MGAISTFINLHERAEQLEIEKIFLAKSIKLIFGFAFKSVFQKNVKALDLVADYFGEEFAFYIAWLLHYTHFLLYPSFFGLLIYLI